MADLATVSFQYMEPHDELPRAGYEMTDGDFNLPPGVPIPRTGEFIQYVTGDGTKDYVVLAVNMRIFHLGENVNWHTVITLGPTESVTDQRLLAIRE